MKGLDELKDELDQLERAFGADQETAVAVFMQSFGAHEIDPETLGVVAEPRPDLPTAVLSEAVDRGEAGGVAVFTEEDVADFEQRLEDAVDALEADGGPRLDPDDVVAYIAARWEEELPAGDAGVVEHFGEDVSAADLDHVWESVMEAA